MATAAPEVVVSNKAESEEKPLASAMEKPNDVTKDKPIVPPPQDDAKAITKVPEPDAKKTSKGSLDRDVALAKIEDDKRLSYIKAWEESEKTKAENKAQKKVADICAWENTKKASLESELKSIEEKIEKQKAEYAEKIKNKVANVHKEAEEKRAGVEAKRGEDLLKAEESAAKFRVTGQVPTTTCGCMGG